MIVTFCFMGRRKGKRVGKVDNENAEYCDFKKK